MRSRGYVQTFEIAAPTEPAMAWPSAGRASPSGESKDDDFCD